MNKPKLVILAAGMGSRYGGLKQIDPIDEYGHIIIDFSIYDAKEAGFEDVIFIIKKEIEEDFKQRIGYRIEKQMNVTYVYQELCQLPAGFELPEGRSKPWGTGHALLCCKEVIDGPFAVINADDFYGKSAFLQIYQYLTSHEDDELYRYAMVGYLLENTVTENGSVARGVCSVDENGYLTDILEKTHIERQGKEIVSIDEAANREILPADSAVSMNLWGFGKSIINELEKGFQNFLKEALNTNPLKAEYFIPIPVDILIKHQKASVKVLPSHDKWYGVTYQEDKEMVVKAVSELKKQGKYPQRLW